MISRKYVCFEVVVGALGCPPHLLGNNLLSGSISSKVPFFVFVRVQLEIFFVGCAFLTFPMD